MVAIEDVITAVNNGKVLSMQRMSAAVLLLKKGASVDGLKDLYALKRLIRVLTFQINANVTNDDSDALYVCLLNQLNGFGASYTEDPTVKNPGGSSTATGAITLVKSQSNLIEDGAGSGNWYLPFLDNNGDPITSGQVPVSVITTGESFTFRFDETFTPARIYGFANNDSQQIKVRVV